MMQIVSQWYEVRRQSYMEQWKEMDVVEWGVCWNKEGYAKSRITARDTSMGEDGMQGRLLISQFGGSSSGMRKKKSSARGMSYNYQMEGIALSNTILFTTIHLSPVLLILHTLRKGKSIP